MQRLRYCYFDNDCQPDYFCNYQRGTNCHYKIPKAEAPARATDPVIGCSQYVTLSTGALPPHRGAYNGTCDGACVPRERSACRVQSVANTYEAVSLWAQAFAAPALHGGGTIDATLAAQARAVPVGASCEHTIDRLVASLLDLCVGEGFIRCPNAGDTLETHVLTDIRNDLCRVATMNTCVSALLQEIAIPGSGLESLRATSSNLSRVLSR